MDHVAVRIGMLSVVSLGGGEVGVWRRSSPSCADTSLQLARCPPLRTQLEDIPAVSLHPPPIRDRAASDQGPGHRTVTYGVVAARRPPMDDNRPTPHVPQPLLHLVRRLRASQALTDSDVALLTEQARGGVRQV